MPRLRLGVTPRCGHCGAEITVWGTVINVRVMAVRVERYECSHCDSACETPDCVPCRIMQVRVG